MHKLLDRIGDWNPQLFRELKGRFNLRNGAIAVGGSVCFQLFLLLIYGGRLPNSIDVHQYNRYCNGSIDEYLRSTHQCIPNALGDGFQVNWQLWHFDFFVGLSLLGMLGLLLIGSHLIGTDLVQEEKRGTLGFVRLSPQSVRAVIVGKMLGVPSLLYLGMVVALPLQWWLGFRAGIAGHWMLMVDLMAIAASVGFFPLAAMWSLVGNDFFAGFQAWLYSAALGFYLMLLTIMTLDSNLPSNSPFDWLRMFYPGNIFYYLVNDSGLGVDQLNYWQPGAWFNGQWYGAGDWSGMVSLGVMVGHYFILAAIAWHGIERRYYEPETTLISKKMGYFIALLSTVMVTGFATAGQYDYHVLDNFEGLQVLYLGIVMALMLAMTPSRQRVQDWSRLRHQGGFVNRPLTDLLVGDRSPAILAIAVMLITSTIFVALVALAHPLLLDKGLVLAGLMLQGGFLVLTALVIQMIFLQRRRRGMLLLVTLASLVILPPLFFSIFGDRFLLIHLLGLFSAFPIMAIEKSVGGLVLWSIAGQWLAIVGSSIALRRHIRRLGHSEMKTLLTSQVESPKNMLT